MKRRTRLLLAAAAAFALLFAARFAYELSRGQDRFPAEPGIAFDAIQQSEAPASYSRKNYASAKIVIAQPSAAQTVDQKYERVSTIESRSKDWDADAAALEIAIAAVEAVVQKENASGLPGSRVLALTLGVIPSAFDEAVSLLKGVGELQSINTIKTDRTADFLALEARRLSLEKTRDGLAALRNSGAALADRIALETRVLEIEGQIQDLAVSLGDYSENNSFCTVRLTLREGRPASPLRRIAAAAMDALAWTAGVYLGLVVASLGVLAASWLGLKLYDSIRGQGKAGFLSEGSLSEGSLSEQGGAARQAPEDGPGTRGTGR